MAAGQISLCTLRNLVVARLILKHTESVYENAHIQGGFPKAPVNAIFSDARAANIQLTAQVHSEVNLNKSKLLRSQTTEGKYEVTLLEIGEMGGGWRKELFFLLWLDCLGSARISLPATSLLDGRWPLNVRSSKRAKPPELHCNNLEQILTLA